MKKFILIILLIPLLNTSALEVVNGNTTGITGAVGQNTVPTGFIAPGVKDVQTSTSEFLGTFFGSPSAVGQQVPMPISSLNGIPYDVWMNGPVLSRYYNTNIYNANRSPYFINTTLPLVNQTTSLRGNSFSVF